MVFLLRARRGNERKEEERRNGGSTSSLSLSLSLSLNGYPAGEDWKIFLVTICHVASYMKIQYS